MRDIHTEYMYLNMGPSHPATHGTVNFKLTLDGETIVDIDPDIGFLHRGMEKTSETKKYHQVIPYTDRLNYVSPLINNAGYCLAVEKLLGIEAPRRAQFLRVLTSELSRICDHLTAVAATALEIGAFTPMIWAVEARDFIYNLIEKITGARVTTSYARIGGVKHDLPSDFAEEWKSVKEKVLTIREDIDKLLTKNRVFHKRYVNTGKISKELAVEFGWTGVCLRSTGVAYDVRKAHPYFVYGELDFEVPVTENGDNFDRYLIRMEEILQSIKIVDQCLEKMPEGDIIIKNWKYALPEKELVYNTIEGMIAHFEIIMKGIIAPPGEVYAYVEGANGELGFYIVSDGEGGPYRLHVRPPSFALMQALPTILKGAMYPDIIPTFDSVNMIGGEIDR